MKNCIPKILVFFLCAILSTMLKANTNQLIKGTFFQMYDSANTWSQEQWDNEFQSVKNLKKDKVIIQYVKRADSPTSTPYLNLYSALGKILVSADKYKIQVMIGLVNVDNWPFSNPVSSTYMNNLFVMQSNTIEEIFANYSSYTQFKGIYIPEEIDNNKNWNVVANKTLITNYWNSLSDLVHSKLASAKTITAPYFGPANGSLMSASEWQTWWNATLANSGLDIIMFQDGIGTGRNTISVTTQYFRAVREAVHTRGKLFWPIIENFKQIQASPFIANPASIVTMKSQILNEQIFLIFT